MKSAISTVNLVKRYGNYHALDGFSITIPIGATMGLIGCNGAGKTTWMMTMAGLVLPDSGKIDILGLGPFDATKHGGLLSILPQDSEPPLEASARELLVSYAKLQGMTNQKAKASADELIKAFNLEAHAGKRIRALSHGMRKRIMAAQAFLGNPKVVLLDEPLSGLDPIEANRMRSFIRARRGRQTIIISSHDLNDIEKLCTHVAFIAKGKVEKTDVISNLMSQSGYIVYTLCRKPDDLTLLERKTENLELIWADDKKTLTASFPSEIPPEKINSLLLPELLNFGVISITARRSLEEMYLDMEKA
jgi:ABC-type multidrug transport system ATPase subunit